MSPGAVAIGKDQQSGNFRTAVLKEYPAAFSAALAGAVADRLVYAQRHNLLYVSSLAHPDIETWLRGATAACKVIRTDAPWLPDFQG